MPVWLVHSSMGRFNRFLTKDEPKGRLTGAKGEMRSEGGQLRVYMCQLMSLGAHAFRNRMLADSTIIDSFVALRQLFLYIRVSCDLRINLPL